MEGSDDNIIIEGETQTITVEARDEFNGPQQGVRINASASRGNLIQNGDETDTNGQAAFQYNATGVSPNTNVTLNFSLGDAESIGTQSRERYVQLNLSVTAGGGNGGQGGEINPADTGRLRLESSDPGGNKDRNNAL